MRRTNVAFERHKQLNRKQRDRESLEQFWGALAEMAKKCNISARYRDIFINNKKNSVQCKLLSETVPPLEALNVALIDKKGLTNHMKILKKNKSNGSSLTKRFNHFKVKGELALNIERSDTRMKRGGTFSKEHLAVCPAKDTTCTSCKNRGHFTRLCISRRKNRVVNNIDSQIVQNTDCDYPSEQRDLNNDRVNRKCCGVINA